jgi:hypothetical protein
MDAQRFLIGLGLIILVVGIAWPISSRIGLGRLPGDIVFLGERLYGLIRAPKRFVRIPGSGHDDLGDRAVAAAKQFIAAP